MPNQKQFDGFTVDLSHYRTGIWGFADAARVRARETLVRLHARDLSKEIALLKDGADTGVSLHPHHPPIEIALRHRDIYRAEVPWSALMGNPYAFQARVFIGHDPDRPYIQVDAEKPDYAAALAELPGVAPFSSPLGEGGDPDLLYGVENAHISAGLGLSIKVQQDTAEVRTTWEHADGIADLIIQEQPTPAERLARLQETAMVRPRVDLTEHAFAPLEQADLYEYRRRPVTV